MESRPPACNDVDIMLSALDALAIDLSSYGKKWTKKQRNTYDAAIRAWMRLRSAIISTGKQ